MQPPNTNLPPLQRKLIPTALFSLCKIQGSCILAFSGVEFVLSVKASFSFVCCAAFYIFSPKTIKISLLIALYVLKA